MKKTLQKIYTMVLGLAVGVGSAMAMFPWIEANTSKADGLLMTELKMFGGFIPAILIAYLLMVVCHEGGHLLAGLMSGYSFVSFRVFSLMLIRLNGKLQWKRFSLAGTGGQCLMKPPQWTDQGIPVKLYNWGGVIVNAVLCVLSGLLLLIVPVSTYFGAILMMTLVLNVWGLLQNGVPLLGNDADNALHLSGNLVAQRAFWGQMMGNALLAEGVPLTELPSDLYDVPEDADLTNPLIAGSAVNATQMLMIHRRFDEADAQMAKILGATEAHLHPAHRFLVQSDRLWLELIRENRPDVVQAMQTKEFKQYQKAMRTHPGTVRTQITLALAQGDAKAADAHRTALDKIAKTYPYQQEIDEERALVAMAEAKFH